MVQKEIRVDWKNTCNLTIGAALLAEKRATSSSINNQLEDELYQYFKKELPNNPKFPGKKPSGDVVAAMKMAIDPNFNYNVKFAIPNKQNDNDLTSIIKAKIDSGTVVGVSGLFRRPGHKNGDAKHIIEIVGYNDKGWIVNDPFGKFENAKWGHSGMQGTMELYEYGQHDLTKRKAYWLEQKK
ncbi:hypothetical protein [Turneriella parva]|uniref:Peptidase C39-like domain-containing protein n=1 Tax=Turneriella parva (strain ATCC BAA-1111 / DSM 21527 / NCTC 11395 / H) TaxID=869212 RepID=I4B4E9_TURPD|nr:hypothetical protein [Turneriella parva]AFM12156.1 hypothetical protein Turpa_1508 [Turneriella parva DSM 21527]